MGSKWSSCRPLRLLTYGAVVDGVWVVRIVSSVSGRRGTVDLSASRSHENKTPTPPSPITHHSPPQHTALHMPTALGHTSHTHADTLRTNAHRHCQTEGGDWHTHPAESHIDLPIGKGVPKHALHFVESHALPKLRRSDGGEGAGKGNEAARRHEMTNRWHMKHQRRGIKRMAVRCGNQGQEMRVM